MAYCLLPTQGKLKFCSPLSSTDTFVQMSKSVVAVPGPGKRLKCTCICSLKIGLWAFSTAIPGSPSTGASKYRSRRSRGYPCTSPRSSWPSNAHADLWLSCYVMHCSASPWNSSKCPSASTGAQTGSGNGLLRGSMASLRGSAAFSDSGVSSISSTMFA